MSVFRFPFNWGSDTPAVVIPPVVTVPPSGTRWSTVGATSKAWTQGASVAIQHRFERVFEQPRTVFGQSINFAFHVQSQFPFKVQTGTHVNISSTLSTP